MWLTSISKHIILKCPVLLLQQQKIIWTGNSKSCKGRGFSHTINWGKIKNVLWLSWQRERLLKCREEDNILSPMESSNIFTHISHGSLVDECLDHYLTQFRDKQLLLAADNLSGLDIFIWRQLQLGIVNPNYIVIIDYSSGNHHFIKVVT